MLDPSSGLSGPDFLDAVADAELAAGHSINSDIYRQRARDWRQDLADLERAHQRLEEQSRALDRARAEVRESIVTLQRVA